MGNITKKKLETILLLHEKWLYRRSNGVRADLSGLDLKGVNLHGVNLCKQGQNWKMRLYAVRIYVMQI